MQITADKEPALYAAIDNIFEDRIKHRDIKYKNNCLEQDHRRPKSRLSVMKGFKNIFCALQFCTVFHEVRQLFKMNDKTRAERRSLFSSRFQEFNNLALNAV